MKAIACLTLMLLGACTEALMEGDGTRALNQDMQIGPRSQPTSGVVVN